MYHNNGSIASALSDFSSEIEGVILLLPYEIYSSH